MENVTLVQDIQMENVTLFQDGKIQNVSDFLVIDQETGMIDRSNWIHILYVILLCANTVAGNIGNVFVIGAIVCDKRLRKESNLFILNLALADLCVTAFVDPFSIAGALTGPDFFIVRNGLCHFIGSICLISCVCSLYSIAAISFNRYILMCKRRWYRTIFTWKRTVYIIIGLWLFALILDLPNFLEWGDHSFDMKTLSCSYDRTASYSYTVFFISFFVLIPLFTVIFCNINIYIVVVRSGMRVAAHKEFITDTYSVTQATNYQTMKTDQSPVSFNEDSSNPVQGQLSTCIEEETPSQQKNQLHVPKLSKQKKFTKQPNNSDNKKKKKINLSTELKLAKTLFIVFMLFCLCWTPYALICLIDRFDKQPKEAYLYCILMAHGSSTLNSIVYALTNKSFRDGYKKFLRLCWDK